MSTYCVICSKWFSGKTVKLVRVPKDSARKSNWENALGIALKDNARVCENHFEDGDWKVKTNTNKLPKRRQLMPKAVPRIGNSLKGTQRDSCTQTNPETIITGVNLENMYLRSKIRELQKENKSLKKDLDEMDTLIRSLRHIFTDSQLVKLKLGRKKFRWNSEDIAYALSLQEAGPRAYDYLYEKGFPLPCTSTLQKWEQKRKSKTEGTSEDIEDIDID